MAKTVEAPHARTSNNDTYRSDDLRNSPTMARLLEALKQGTDIGHNGQFVFISAARHFLKEEEIVRLLSKQPDMDAEKARAQYLHIAERGYNPPGRERILQMQAQQEYPIIEKPEDPDSGNLYRELRFPEDVYEDINEYYEEKVEAGNG